MKKNLKVSFIALMCVLFFEPFTFGQQVKQEETQALTQVLAKLSVAFKVNFLYEESQLKEKQLVYQANNFSGKPLKQILDAVILPLNLSWYKVDDKNYSIFPTVSNTAAPVKQKVNPGIADSVAKDQVSGRLLDEHARPLEYTTVTLLVAADSSFVINSLTDPDGKFTFPSVKPGIYKIRVSPIGYSSYTTRPFTVGGNAPVSIAPISIQSSGENLKEVKITASKPLVEAKSDRLIFNVDNSAMAVGNSLQVLKSAPFVRISADNTVSLQGKRTMILIDGKPVPDAALENILQTMPAGNILKIELITQPSAKYDAAFGAVINIITKKSQIEGFTGDVRADGSTGKYASANLNTSATYKRKNLTLYASGGVTKGTDIFSISSERSQDPTDPLYYLTNNWSRITDNNLYNFQASAELQLDKNQSIGLLANGGIFYFKGPWATTNAFGRKNTRIDSVSYTDATFNQRASSYTYNFNYHLLADSGRNELLVLATFTPWQRNLFQDFPSVLYDGAGNIIRIPTHYQNRNKAAIDVYIAQTDYIHEFKKQWKLEAGFKFQYTNSNTSVDYQDNRNGQFESNPIFSNQSNLKESIASVYGILSKDWKKDKVQMGLRIENTRADFVDNFKQDYSNFFPTFLYQHNFNQDNNISISYKPTINRAPYYELVPYTVLLNRYTIEQGNPSLTPQFNDTYTLSANIHKLNLSLSYTHTKGTIGLFPYKQDLTTKVTYFTRQNLNRASDVSLYLFYPIKINDWWETLNSGTPIGYNIAEGPVLGTNYKLAAFHSDFKSSQVFKISKNLKLQIDAYYWTSYVQDLSKNSGYKNIDASFLLNLWEGKGQLRLGGNELVFKRNDYLIERNYGTFNSAERVSNDSKRVFVGFTYKFGKSKIQKSDTKLGNEDALKRL
ncbi:TonB-dependent receptor [Pedobacter sp. MR2016-19]|uniref:outer membrane beta-barrel family protein n=1 Tax=Pedobacter sp. MR2016-19 TaxID=2780089 RepID=UPI001876B927|nr:outer membrane beta-barrel family protein [Pedobacter sp. MR2016-19]MBE5322341.1 TonB-dependent receptor [Pedobacter sp. MR2016-19]